MMRSALLVPVLALPLLASPAFPARAKPLKTAPSDSEAALPRDNPRSAAPKTEPQQEKLPGRDVNLVKLQAKLAAAEATLQELHALALLEARLDDVEALASQRNELLARHEALAHELDLGQDALCARIRVDFIAKATLLARDTKATRNADVPGRLGSITEERTLNERIGDFWGKRHVELGAERKAFEQAKARAEAARRQRRRLAAGGGGAVLLLLWAVAFRRRSRLFPPLAALLALLAAATAVPARAKPLKAAPSDSEAALPRDNPRSAAPSDSEAALPRDNPRSAAPKTEPQQEKLSVTDVNVAELQAKLAAAEATLQEFRALALREARSDDVEALASERGELIARHEALCGELDPAQQALSARIRVSWIAGGTLLAKATKAAADADVPGRLGPVVEEEELDRRIGDFWERRRAERESEQKAFDLARARVEAARRQQRLLRRLAAGGGGAALLVLLAVVFRRRRKPA